ncbi:MAG: hypothetical protein ABI949_02215 [Ilumatobacteraceae bacterium]
MTVAAVAFCTLTACSADAPPATDAQYCSTVSESLDQLNAPAIADSTGVEATSKLYRSITSIAPLAVQKEWQTMTSNIEAAATVDPQDPASVQRVADMARSSQHAATAISDYTSKLCGVSIGPAPAALVPVVITGPPASTP